MRQNYYDREDQPRPVPEPYGPVPGQGAPVPAIVQTGPFSAPAPEAPGRPTTPQGGRGVRRFALFFALLLLLTGTQLLLQGGLGRSVSPLEAVGELWRRIDPFYDWGYYQSEAWTDDLAETTVERAPTGDGATLTLSPAGEETLDPQQIYARVAPAVVGIRAAVEQGTALGTGVVMSPNGYIITNAHVIAGARSVSVTLSDNSHRSAKLVGYDGATDLAVLKIGARGLPTAEFGDSAALRVGEPAYAIGNPLGEELRGTMTDGIISAIDRNVDMNGQEMTLLQTTAALNSGNSGGALVNAAGQVVGITNMKMMSDWETIEGLGFAIPSVQVKAVVDQIIATGSYVGKPRLGITVADHFDASGSPDGARVVSVHRASDAYGKLWTADVIVAAGGEAVKCTDDLLRIKDRLSVGGELTLRVRPGDPELPVEEVTVTLMSANDLAGGSESTSERPRP